MDRVSDQEGFSQRVRELIDESGLTARRYSISVEIDTSNFSRKLKGDLPWTVNDMGKICNKDNVNREWLLRGTGRKRSVDVQGEQESEENRKPHIPTEVIAGGVAGIAEAVTLGMCEMKPIVKLLPNYDYTITIKGDSMEPKFEGGDVIAIKKVFDYIEWGKAYVLDTNDGAVIKRLYDDGDKYRCVSYNKEYPDFTIDKENVIAVYRVVGLIRI